ncbi:hypothetical protein ACSBR1_027206 [Camellia fascicularis]
MGHAFHTSPFHFKNSSNGSAFFFSTSFAFVIVLEYPKLGGHGLTFTLSPSVDLPTALPSQYLGLLNASDIGYEPIYVGGDFDRSETEIWRWWWVWISRLEERMRVRFDETEIWRFH